jgi:hypothetical protein
MDIRGHGSRMKRLNGAQCAGLAVGLPFQNPVHSRLRNANLAG